VALAPSALAAAGYTDGEPDLIVDATGRRQDDRRLLDLPTRRGPRDDVAHFAHFEGLHVGQARRGKS
jgi:hypothetical protein